MPDLNDYRAQIDEIDRQLAPLFAERMRLSTRVAEYKRARGMEILQTGREQAVLEGVERLSPPDQRRNVLALYREILRISKAAQRERFPAPEAPALSAWVENPIVAYFGAEGAFSEQAALEFFGSGLRPVALPALGEVARAVASGQADYGVMPIENSSTGSISEAYDQISREALRVVGEQNLRIRQHLLALPGARLETIRRVYSHAQGIAQCGEFFHNHPDWQLIPYKNTAISARKVLEDGDPSQAAVASERAATRYGLEILQKDIHEDKRNHTRFVVVAREMALDSGAEKATVVFNTVNRPGALARVLQLFAERRLNMTRLESRPIPQRPWEYTFYADFEGQLRLEELMETLKAVAPETESIRLLGLYRKGREV